MSKEITIEVDDIHELMYTEVSERIDEDVPIEQWAEDTLTTLLYQQYKAE